MNSESIINKENECNNNKEENLVDNSQNENNNDNIFENNKQNIDLDLINNNKGKNIEDEQSYKIPNLNFINDYYKEEDLKIENNKTKDGKYILDINEIIGKKEFEMPITLEILNESFENYSKSKVSSRDFGIIKAYAVNTNQGIVRDYNEDRVSIVINMVKPDNCNIDDLEWPRISYFGIFDGHAGSKCADYLKDNLIKKISDNNFFPKDIKKAIYYGFQSAEKDFLENYAIQNGQLIDKSGSCALILLTVDNLLYVANVGDSRCVISCKNGKILKDVTRDHKPNYPYEKERIIKNNGTVYQSETPIDIELEGESDNNILKDKVILGPYRVNPGRLSVSRTIGDAEAKIPELGGNPNVIISEPDIYIYDLEKDDVDFFILGCDGIYDQLSSKDVLDCAWMVLNDISDEIKNNLNTSCGNIIDIILKMSMIRKSYDNVTSLIVAFKERNEYRNYSKKEKNHKKSDTISFNEINQFFSKIKNNDKPKIKLNKVKEKTILTNKNTLPTLKLLNPNKNNNFKLKKLFKENNNFFNYINKLKNYNNKLRNAEENSCFRHISVPRNQNVNNINSLKINRNNINTHKNDIQKIKKEYENYSLNSLTSFNNNKNSYDELNFIRLTQNNNKNNFKNKIKEKNKILANSSKNSRMNSLYLIKNSSYCSIDDEVDSNSKPIQNNKNINAYQGTPISIRLKNNNDSPYNINYIKFHSVNKKNNILTDTNLIHNNEKQINKNDKIYNMRLKSVDDKLPLYQKAFKGTLSSQKNKEIYTRISDRNKKNNISLNNKKINRITYDNFDNAIKKDDLSSLINNQKIYPLIDDKHTTLKPVILKLELKKDKNENNRHSNDSLKYNSLENNNNDAKMPLISQQRRIETISNNK